MDDRKKTREARDGDRNGLVEGKDPSGVATEFEQLLRRLVPREASRRVETRVLGEARETAEQLAHNRRVRRRWRLIGLAAAATLMILLWRAGPDRPPGEMRSEQPRRPGVAVRQIGDPPGNGARTAAPGKTSDPVAPGTTTNRSSTVAASLPNETTLMARTLQLELEVARLRRLARHAVDRPGYRAQLDLLETTLETIQTRLIDRPPAPLDSPTNQAPEKSKERTGHESSQKHPGSSHHSGSGVPRRPDVVGAIS